MSAPFLASFVGNVMASVKIEREGEKCLKGMNYNQETKTSWFSRVLFQKLSSPRSGKICLPEGKKKYRSSFAPSVMDLSL